MKTRAALSAARSLAQTGTQLSASVNAESDSHLEFTAHLSATHSQCCQCGSCCIFLCVTGESLVSFNFSNVNLLFLVCGNYTVSICWGGPQWDVQHMQDCKSKGFSQDFIVPTVTNNLNWAEMNEMQERELHDFAPQACWSCLWQRKQREKYMIVGNEFDLWISGHQFMTWSTSLSPSRAILLLLMLYPVNLPFTHILLSTSLSNLQIVGRAPLGPTGPHSCEKPEVVSPPSSPVTGLCHFILGFSLIR